jgi:DHA3 family macrolide efflux protein-like MFS transporter
MSTTATNPSPPVIDPELPQPMSMGAVLRISMMRRLWYAQIISVFGDFLALFAVIGVLTFKLHATPQQVTGVSISYMLPIAILGIIAGVFVDRWPLKPTMVSSDSLRAVLVLLLLFAHQTWHFYAILAAISVVSSFFGPAQGVAIRSAVPLHGLRSANALMQQVMFGMRIIGPAIAAWLVATFGARVCYLADATSFVGSALLIASVPFVAQSKPTPAAPEQPTEQSALIRIWTDMKQGINFIFHHAGLLFVILAMASAMFVVGCFGPLIAVYVRDSLHASANVFGIASALIGAGMLIGINALNALAKNVKNTVLVYAGLSGIALGLLFLTIFTHVWSTMLGDFIIGVAIAGIIIPAQTMMQQETPPALMGRVGSTMMSLIFGAQILGLILSGILANQIGARYVFAVCAALLAILITVGRLWMEPKGEPVAA